LLGVDEVSIDAVNSTRRVATANTPADDGDIAYDGIFPLLRLLQGDNSY